MLNLSEDRKSHMRLIYWIPLIFFMAAIGIIIFDEESVGAEYDFFAKCLTKKGFTMYGADWCPHCQNEKKAFGDSFRFINYVECPDNPQKCLEKGVNGYPTWMINNGKRFEGEQGLEKLSRESRCPLKS